jgi:hypothetical protein
MHDQTDETIERIAAALRPLPEVDPSQKARVLLAVAAERERSRVVRASAPRSWRLVASGGTAAAVVVAAALWVTARHLATRPDDSSRAAASDVVAPAAAASDARLATRTGDAVAPQVVELVFRAPNAHRVSVVGDFNGWNAHADALTRDPASGLWSGMITVRPGRHVYAFVIDDSDWARDPRTPAAADADFGRPGSVLLVGRP